MKKLLLALMLTLTSAFAQDTEIMNQNQLEYKVRPDTNVILYFRTRYDLNISHMLQIKPGLIIEKKQTDRFTGLIGYYNQSDWNKKTSSYVNIHRSWIGGRYVLFTKKDHVVESRYIFETFVYPDTVKVRSRARVLWEYRNHWIVPTTSYEYLRFQNTNTKRISGMITHNFDDHLSVGVGFEARQMPSTMKYDLIPYSLIRYHIK